MPRPLMKLVQTSTAGNVPRASGDRDAGAAAGSATEDASVRHAALHARNVRYAAELRGDAESREPHLAVAPQGEGKASNAHP